MFLFTTHPAWVLSVDNIWPS